MITFTEIVGCDGTVIYEIAAKQMTFFTSGRLQIHIAYDGMLLLKLNEFEYSVNGSEKIVFDNTDPQFALVLYLKKYPNDQWIIKINQNADAVYSCLQQKCYLKNKNQKYQKPAKTVEPPQKKQKKKEIVVHQEQQEQQQKDKGLLIEASKQLGRGLTFTGKLLSKGISSLGGYISKKIPKQQDKQISETTKENLKLAKNTTKNVLSFASAQVGNLFTFGKKVAEDVGQRFEHSDKGKQLKENPHYETVKEGAKTGVGVLANLYVGVVGAVYAVGSGVAQGVGKVVGAKYGEQAGDVADQAFEGAGNVLKIMRVPADQMANTLKQ